MVAVAGFSVTGFEAMAQEERKDKDGNTSNQNEVPLDNPTPVKNIEKIVGEWEVTSVLNGSKNITDTDTAQLNRSFVFTRENKYISYSNNEQIDSGAFKLNEVQNVVYLESATGNDVAEYRVRFDDNTMTLEPMENADANAQRFRYVYTRKSNGGR